MKTLYLTLFVLIISICQVFGQKLPKPKWGKPVSLDSKKNYSSYMSVLGINEGHYYVQSDTKKSSKLLIFTLNHKPVAEITPDFGPDHSNLEIYRTVKTRQGVYLLLFELKKKEKKETYYISKIDSGQLGPLLTLCSLDLIKDAIPPDTDYRDKIDYKFVYTNDSTSIALIIPLNAKSRKNKEKIKVIMMDEQLNPIWEKVQEFPLEDQRTSIYQTVLSEDKTIHLLAKCSKKLNKSSKRVPDYTYKVLSISENKSNIRDIDIGTEFEVTKIGIYPGKSDASTFHIAGLYTTKETKGRKGEGVFYQKFNSTSERFDPPVTKVLTRGDYANVELPIDKKRKKKVVTDSDPYGLLYRYNISDLFSYADGTFGFICEGNYIYNYPRTNGRVIAIPYSVDIMILFFNSDGSFRGATNIFKNIGELGDIKGGYACAFRGDFIYLLFNERVRKKNAKVKAKSINRKPSDSIISTHLAILDRNTGEVLQNKKLFKSLVSKYNYEADLTVQDKDYLLFGRRDSEKYQFGNIQLDASLIEKKE